VLSFIKNIFKGRLHKACAKGNIEAVKQLLADGADVNARNNWQQTPLGLAACRDEKGYYHKEIVKLLIAKGANVNAKDEFGHSPLHSATSEGLKEIAELLIAEGADVNAMSVFVGRDMTPLDWATLFDDESETIDLLRKHGAKTSEELKAEGK